MASSLHPHNLVYHRFCQEPDLSSTDLMRVNWMGIVDLLGRFGGKCGEWPLLQSHTTSLSRILPRAWKDGATRSLEVGITESPDIGTNRSLMKGSCHSGS